MSTESHNVNDLIDDLRQETENAGIGKSTPEETPEKPAQPPAGDDSGEYHFDPPLGETQPQDPPIDIGKAQSIAMRYVKMFSSFMKMLLTPLYRKTILEDDDIKKMQAFRQKHHGKSEKEMDEAVHSDHDMWPVVNRFDQYMKAVQEIPLDEDEKKMIAEPLGEVIQKYKAFQLSPEWMLLIAVAMVMFPRMVKLIPDVNKAEAKA